MNWPRGVSGDVNFFSLSFGTNAAEITSQLTNRDMHLREADVATDAALKCTRPRNMDITFEYY